MTNYFKAAAFAAVSHSLIAAGLTMAVFAAGYHQFGVLQITSLDLLMVIVPTALFGSVLGTMMFFPSRDDRINELFRVINREVTLRRKAERKVALTLANVQEPLSWILPNEFAEIDASVE
ncbi:hypothetical protein IZ6_24640 [Terrihabitans soli]|uniref:Uncharacterized protein n=1 Tax=Terrihabitans soli TaxID=708113 RepID=A0A6S6QRQ1_9HYPH|nr:hypothetical protein [Terrihabitans soli]BCJ91729.1 hypothetical protein IZ6_24640 [Terrihabitans soli]